MFHSYASHETFVLSSSADMKNYTQDIEVEVRWGGCWNLKSQNIPHVYVKPYVKNYHVAQPQVFWVELLLPQTDIKFSQVITQKKKPYYNDSELRPNKINHK